MSKQDGSHGHKSQWEKVEAKYIQLSKDTDDIYDKRAKACRRLLTLYC